MNKQELVASVSTKAGLTKKDTDAFLKSLVEAIQEALVKGDDVQIAGLGKFASRMVSGREGISKLQGGEKAWKTEDHKVPTFKFAKNIKDAVK